MAVSDFDLIDGIHQFQFYSTKKRRGTLKNELFRHVMPKIKRLEHNH